MKYKTIVFSFLVISAYASNPRTPVSDRSSSRFPASETPDCIVSMDSNLSQLAVMTGVPSKFEWMGQPDGGGFRSIRSRHSTLVEARDAVRDLIAISQCKISFEKLPECQLGSISRGEEGTIWAILLSLPNDPIDLRFRLPMELPVGGDTLEAFNRTLKNLTESDVPLCKRPTTLPECALVRSANKLKLVALNSDGSQRVIKDPFDGSTSLFIKLRGVFCQ